MEEKKAFVKNAADEEQVKEAGKKVKSKREQELNDVRFILSQPQGRRFVWRYLRECRIFASIWDPSSRIHFNEGMRNVGLMLLADATEASPEAYLQMQKEMKGELNV